MNDKVKKKEWQAPGIFNLDVADYTNAKHPDSAEGILSIGSYEAS